MHYQRVPNYPHIPTKRPPLWLVRFRRLVRLGRKLFSVVATSRIGYAVCIVVYILAVAAVLLYASPVVERLLAIPGSPSPDVDSSTALRNVAMGFASITLLVIGLVALPFTVIRSIALHRQARIAEQGHITDRFTKAIELLGSESIYARLGAIFALERIAQDSVEKDHWAAMETLSSFVRTPPSSVAKEYEERSTQVTCEEGENRIKSHCGEAKNELLIAADVQAAITVLGRRNNRQLALEQKRKQVVDLRGADLRGADLRFAVFDGAIFQGADLRGAKMQGADLISADLRDADLRNGHAVSARFAFASLEGADFEAADLRQADFTGSTLTRTSFQRADVRGTRFLGAYFSDTDLRGAQLKGDAINDDCLISDAELASSITLEDDAGG